MSPTRSKFIDPSAVIGYSPRHLQGSYPWAVDENDGSQKVELPDAIYVGAFASIGAGAKIGYGCVIDAYCRIEPFAILGEDSLMLYRGTVGFKAQVGKRCIIGGSVSEFTILEDGCTSFGKLIHKHWDSVSAWDYRDEVDPSPTIRRHSFIGHDSLVIGGIEVGPLSYVCAGAIVTRPVPPYYIAYGVNKKMHYSKWQGKLSENPMFQIKL